MTMNRKVMAILLRGRRFYHCWRKIDNKGAGALHRYCFNLQRESLFHQNLNRSMSLANLPLPENDKEKFLEHIADAFTNGVRSDFETILKHGEVKKLITKRFRFLENIESLKELENDEEMKQLAEEEKLTQTNRLKELDDELIDLLTESMVSEDFNDIILEIYSGVGGQEAMLFAKELLDMYMKHLPYLGYSFDLLDLDLTEEGGIRHASLIISGEDAFKKLRHEAGSHRVQRIPTTEKSGRIHTSIATVAVLPQPSEIEVEIDPKDIKLDTMRSQGAGGQSVQTTNSAVRLTHYPTGIVVECQSQKSQIQNRTVAMAKLRAKIYQLQFDSQRDNTTSMRKKQMGTKQRNEKIRTYNYNQDRITDHRLQNGTLHNLKGFMNGGEALDNLHMRLHQDLKRNTFIECVSSLIHKQ